MVGNSDTERTGNTGDKDQWVVEQYNSGRAVHEIAEEFNERFGGDIKPGSVKVTVQRAAKRLGVELNRPRSRNAYPGWSGLPGSVDFGQAIEQAVAPFREAEAERRRQWEEITKPMVDRYREWTEPPPAIKQMQEELKQRAEEFRKLTQPSSELRAIHDSIQQRAEEFRKLAQPPSELLEIQENVRRTQEQMAELVRSVQPLGTIATKPTEPDLERRVAELEAKVETLTEAVNLLARHVKPESPAPAPEPERAPERTQQTAPRDPADEDLEKLLSGGIRTDDVDSDMTSEDLRDRWEKF